LNTEQRLTKLAEVLYPIEAGMCAFRRQGVLNKRVCFVWKMQKELKPLSEQMLNKVLHELETKAGVEQEVPTANGSLDK
jgi:hypothetical protein